MNKSKVILVVAAAILCSSLFCAGPVDGAAAAAATNATTKAATTTAAAAVTTAKPAATTAKPAATTAKPAATTAKPAATTAKPAETTAKPAATTARQAATTKAAANTTKAATTAAAATTAHPFVPVPESKCFMPFWHNNSWHHTCIKYNTFGDFWCSLTSNFTKDEDWKRCSSPNRKRFQCHIPFRYKGVNHTHCLPIDDQATAAGLSKRDFWCATVPEISSLTPRGSDWAYCEHPLATGTAYLNAVGVQQALSPAAVTALGGGGTSASGSAGGAAVGAAAVAPVKSLNGEGHGGAGGGAAAGLSAQATVGVAVGTVCSVLAVAAVVAGVVIRKRRRSRGDHKALLQTREKGTYGGMEASD